MDDVQNIMNTCESEIIMKRTKWAEARRQRRLDPEVRARERIKNLITARRRRQNPELREKERERNRIAMRLKRQNPEFREKEKVAMLMRKMDSEKFKMMEMFQVPHSSVMDYEMYVCHLASANPAKSSGYCEKRRKDSGKFNPDEENGVLPLELEMRVEEEEEDDPEGIDGPTASEWADDLQEEMSPLPLAVTITPIEGGVHIKQEEDGDPSTSLDETTVHEEVTIKEEDGNKDDDVLLPPLAIHIKEEVREEEEEVVVEPPMPVYDVSDDDDDDDSPEFQEKSLPEFTTVDVEEGQNSEEEILPHAAMVVVPGRADDVPQDFVKERVTAKPASRGAKRGRYTAKRVNTVYRCSDCQVCYSSEEYLKNHIQWGCRSRGSFSGVDTVYRCPNCSLCYTSPQYLAGHVRRGCRYRPAPIKNAYSCIVCGEGFNNYGDLYQHKRAKHDNKIGKLEATVVGDLVQPARTFNCPNCPRSFTAPGYLLQHQRSHMRTRTDHSCDVCGEDFRGKSFQQKEQHFTTSHPKSELHRCIQCEKIYGHRLNLVMHLETHGGETLPKASKISPLSSSPNQSST